MVSTQIQPIWKICSSNWIIFAGRDENKKSLKPAPSLGFFLIVCWWTHPLTDPPTSPTSGLTGFGLLLCSCGWAHEDFPTSHNVSCQTVYRKPMGDPPRRMLSYQDFLACLVEDPGSSFMFHCSWDGDHTQNYNPVQWARNFEDLILRRKLENDLKWNSQDSFVPAKWGFDLPKTNSFHQLPWGHCHLAKFHGKNHDHYLSPVN